MTNYYFAYNRGLVDLGPDQVTEGTSSSASSDFELRVLSTNNPTVLDIVQALEAIARYLEDGRFTATPFLG